MRLIRFSSKRSFADYFVILLMSRWRAIFAAEYMSVSASTPIQYSSTNAPLVVTRKKDIPRFLWKCPIHIIDIFVAFLLHVCCIRSNFQPILQLPTTSVTLVNRAFLDILVSRKLSLAELGTLDFTRFLKCGVANTLQTQDFSLLLRTPLNYQRGRWLKVQKCIFFSRNIQTQ